MIGGFGPESTIDYYKILIEIYREKFDSNSYPEIIIYSLDIYKLLDRVERQEWDELVAWLLEAISNLKNAGADFAFISANTPHIVFNQLKERSPLPLISIVEETCNATQRLNIKKVALLGTLFTMQSHFYQDVFNQQNIEIIVPNDDEKNYIHQKLMTEIELGIFKSETRLELLEIIKRMIDEEAVQGVILGCTELPLILTEAAFGIPFINPTHAHVNRILKECID